MPLMRSVQEFANKNPNVQKWLTEDFHDDKTREGYGWHLHVICIKLNVAPDDFLILLDNGPGPLFLKLKQYLIALAKEGHSRKALQIKASVQKYLEFNNNRPQKFPGLDIPIKMKKTFERPYWLLPEFEAIMRHVNRHYEPLFRIGAMAGLGRKELIYLNEHLEDLKLVPGVPEAYWLSMPARKSNEDYWRAILPSKEVDDFKRKAKGRLLTSWGSRMREFNLTEQFARACKRADMRVKGTGVHVLRSVFKSVGSNTNIPDKFLDQNMGHGDPESYNRTDQDLERRAQALIPLWEYFRRGGPAVASSSQVTKLAEEKEQLKEEMSKQAFHIELLEQAIRDLAGQMQAKSSKELADLTLKLTAQDNAEGGLLVADVEKRKQQPRTEKKKDP